jgi:hypothetical protein
MLVFQLDKDKPRPDIQIHTPPYTYTLDYGGLASKFGVSEEAYQTFFSEQEHYPSHLAPWPTLNRPNSRGYVRLASANPEDDPIIQHVRNIFLLKKQLLNSILN